MEIKPGVNPGQPPINPPSPAMRWSSITTSWIRRGKLTRLSIWTAGGSGSYSWTAANYVMDEVNTPANWRWFERSNTDNDLSASFSYKNMDTSDPSHRMDCYIRLDDQGNGDYVRVLFF